MTRNPRRLASIAVGLAFAFAVEGKAPAGYTQHNLVSDIANLADHTDSNLVNPWGIAESGSSPFWVSDQHAGLATLYNTSGTPLGLVVSVPAAGGGGGTGHPSGQVFNGTSDFLLDPNNPASKAIFIFDSTDGSISGWNPNIPAAHSTTATLMVTTPGAAYTGLAIGNVGLANYLYAANIRGGSIDVFDKTFTKVVLAGSFADPNADAAGFSPYNIQKLGNLLFVAYAGHSGGGMVDAFNLDGTFNHRIFANGAGGPLATPWGLTMATNFFGQYAGDLLVGNFGDGRVSAFDPNTNAFLGQIKDASGNFFSEPGLWGLTFGNGGAGGDKNLLYFTAGINGEADGLFGTLSAAPEPGTCLLGLVGALVSFGLARIRAGARRPA